MKGKKGPSGFMMFVSGALTAVGFIGALQRKGKRKPKSDTSKPSSEETNEEIGDVFSMPNTTSRQEVETDKNIDANFSEEPHSLSYDDTHRSSVEEWDVASAESNDVPEIQEEDSIQIDKGADIDDETDESVEVQNSTQVQEEGFKVTNDDLNRPEVEQGTKIPTIEKEDTTINRGIEFEMETYESFAVPNPTKEKEIADDNEVMENLSEGPSAESFDDVPNDSHETYEEAQESIDVTIAEQEENLQIDDSIVNDEEIAVSAYGLYSFYEPEDEADDYPEKPEKEVKEMPAASFQDDFQRNNTEEEQSQVEQQEDEVQESMDKSDPTEEIGDEKTLDNVSSFGETTIAESEEPYPRQEDFKFNVYGVNQKNDEGESIQVLIRKELVLPEINVSKPAYGGMKNKDVYSKLLAGEEVKEVDEIIGRNDISLVKEQSNSALIKVMHARAGHLGYVPSTYTADIVSFLEENPDYDLVWELFGGKFKEIDQQREKVRINSESYSIEIKLYKKK